MIVKKFVVGLMQTNSYLIYNEGYKDAALIDPARGFQKINGFCKEVGVNVTKVLITHGHFDHILEASLWQKSGAKLYIHKLDEDKLQTDKNLAYLVKEKIDKSYADVIVNDNDIIEVAGLKIKVLHTPGHSVGSVCYVTEDYIFSGDTLFAGDHGRVDFPDGSLSDIITSIKKLFALEGNYKVLPGHDIETTLDKERVSNIVTEYK